MTMMMIRTNTLLCSMLLVLATTPSPATAFWVSSQQASALRPKTTRTQTQTTTTTTTARLFADKSGAVSGGAITLDGQEIRGPITPVGNILVVKVKDTLTATGGGILLPDQSKQRPTEGLVLAAGPGRLHPHTGVRITNPVTEGMSVVYGKFDGKPVEYKGEECQIIRDDNVLLAYTGLTLRLDTVVPVRDYVLIELDSSKVGDEPVATSSGVVIAASVLKDNAPCEGRVCKVGEGRMAANGDLTPSPVKEGDTVKFKDYAGNDVMIEGKPYSVVKMIDILCTFTDEGDTADTE